MTAIALHDLRGPAAHALGAALAATPGVLLVTAPETADAILTDGRRATASVPALVGRLGQPVGVPPTIVVLLDPPEGTGVPRPDALGPARSLVRRLALASAPRARVGAVTLGAPVEDIARAVLLLARTAGITGELIALGPAEVTAPVAGRAEPRYREVFLDDLVVAARIGAFKHERDAAQRVRLSVSLLVSDDAGGHADRLDRVVCYDRVAGAARSILEGAHTNLVETAAERIAAACLEDERIASVRIRIEKLDIYAEGAVAGVEIVRGRGSFAHSSDGA